jgi:hypothetical protein
MVEMCLRPTEQKGRVVQEPALKWDLKRLWWAQSKWLELKGC